MNILSEIVDDVRRRVEEAKKESPVEDLEMESSGKRSLRKSIGSSEEVSLIGELKKASPSAGQIREDFRVESLSKSISAGGGAGVSVLTEPKYFDGRLDYVETVKDSVDVPVLRKDFIFDEYQLYRSVEAGADAVLLIVSVLGGSLPRFVEEARGLGLESLVEVHDKGEADIAVSSNPDVIGVNNRDLETMEVSLSRTEMISDLVSEDFPLVSESGVSCRADVEKVSSYGADAVLVGTSIMKSNNVREKVSELVFGD